MRDRCDVLKQRLEVMAMSRRCDKCGKKMDTMLMVDVELRDRTVRLCEECADVVADHLIRELARMERLNHDV